MNFGQMTDFVKLRYLSVLALLCISAFGQMQTDRISVNGIKYNSYTIAAGANQIPAASSEQGMTVVVTDALQAGNCVTGGGSAQSLCRSNGTIWVGLGDGGQTLFNGTPADQAAPYYDASIPGYAISKFTTLHSYGDSMTGCTGIVVQANCYPNRIATNRGWALDNQGVAGYTIKDINFSKLFVVSPPAVNTTSVSTIMDGYNDASAGGNWGNEFEWVMDAALWQLTVTNKIRPASSGTLTGNWNATTLFPNEKASQVNGETWQFVGAGCAVHVVTVLQQSSTAVLTVTVDSRAYSNVPLVANYSGSSAQYTTPADLRYELPCGKHTVLVTATTASGSFPVRIIGAAFSQQFQNGVNGPSVYVGTEPGAINMANASIEQYNARTRKAVSDFARDGFNVVLVDNSNFDPAAAGNEQGDNTHPTDQGDGIIALNFINQMSALETVRDKENAHTGQWAPQRHSCPNSNSGICFAVENPLATNAANDFVIFSLLRGGDTGTEYDKGGGGRGLQLEANGQIAAIADFESRDVQVIEPGNGTGFIWGFNHTTGIFQAGGTDNVHCGIKTDTIVGIHMLEADKADNSGLCPMYMDSALVANNVEWANGSGYDAGISRTGAAGLCVGTQSNGDCTGSWKAATYLTTTNCSSSGGTCSSASAGSVSIAASATTVVVSTTAVTANSQIFVQFDESLGTKLSVTCNSAGTSEGATYFVSARSAGTSFTIKTNTAPTTNPACLSYRIVN